MAVAGGDGEGVIARFNDFAFIASGVFPLAGVEIFGQDNHHAGVQHAFLPGALEAASDPAANLNVGERGFAAAGQAVGGLLIDLHGGGFPVGGGDGKRVGINRGDLRHPWPAVRVRRWGVCIGRGRSQRSEREYEGKREGN